MKPPMRPPTPAQMLRARAALVLRQARDPSWSVPSPCCGICTMDDAGHCQGCWRTLDEIAAWSELDEAGRLAVWRRIKERSA